jgi:hypothetical protein
MILLFGLDLSSKIWIRANVPLYETTELLANLIDLTHVKNPGVSFGFLADFSDFFTWVKSIRFANSSVVSYRGTFALIHIFELRSNPNKRIINIQFNLKEGDKTVSEILKKITPQKKINPLF